MPILFKWPQENAPEDRQLCPQQGLLKPVSNAVVLLNPSITTFSDHWFPRKSSFMHSKTLSEKGSTGPKGAHDAHEKVKNLHLMSDASRGMPVSYFMVNARNMNKTWVKVKQAPPAPSPDADRGPGSGSPRWEVTGREPRGVSDRSAFINNG